jgi:hypothetical protein
MTVWEISQTAQDKKTTQNPYWPYFAICSAFQMEKKNKQTEKP